MARMLFPELAELFVSSLELGGATVLHEHVGDRRPLVCHISDGSRKLVIHSYLWTVTSGGRGRGRPDERRIQITNVDQFRLLPGVQVVVGGYSPDEGVFAFWDVRRHLGFTEGSPSFQISVQTLRRAADRGFDSERREVREGEETAVAVHPDYLLWYMQEYDNIYDCADQITQAPERVGYSTEEDRDFIDSGESESVQASRHRVVTVMQNLRDAKFRPAVMRAYGHRCCISGVALRLVDAAHLVPVADSTSSDDPTNGVAINPLLHRAYDLGLLGIFPGGRLGINDRMAEKLARKKLDSGLDEIRASLPQQIRKPDLPDLHPNDEFLRRGLLARGWTADEINLV